jgi:hypothetical protein
MKRNQWILSLPERMQAAFEQRDPQVAADIIGEGKDSNLVHLAMQAAHKAGFIPEYWPTGVRVSLPVEN